MKNLTFGGIGIEETLSREVKRSGNGAIIFLKKKYVGKKVFVVIPKDFNSKKIVIDEIHTRRVKKFGNGAIVYFFKEYVGRKVLVVIPKEENEK